ncbi:MAG: Fic family protein [Desulfobacteraceae bacterium]|jgi:Fic family protein
MNKYQHITFSKRWEINPEISYLLGQCKTLISAITDTPIQPDLYKELLSLSLIKGAQATTAIEGNTLSFEEIQRISAGKKLPPSKEYQEIEVKNIIKAFNRMLENVAVNNHVQMITPDFIKDMHRMIGENLGEHLDAIPGRFREDSRVVGGYLCPDHRKVQEYVNNLCSWLIKEFNFEQDKSFRTAVIQAIVTHVYIEWIHPFGDGNGRTGRFIEFYILLRAGLPGIASHILSNFYNETRPKYYKQLENARLNNDLTEFIHYAVEGFRDGLDETLKSIQENQFMTYWKFYIFEKFKNMKYSKSDAFKRKRNLALDFPINKDLTIDEIMLASPQITFDYAKTSMITLKRDVKELVEMSLLLKKKNYYMANTGQLKAMTALRRKDMK